MCVNPMIMTPSSDGTYKYITSVQQSDLTIQEWRKIYPKAITVSCGYCVECRLKKSNEWALRCIDEARKHTHNCFLTLTYNDDNLPKNGTLVKKHIQDFMKRLRKCNGDKKIRFVCCGEYGALSRRPHYHLLLFNFFPSDARKISNLKEGYNLFYSPQIEKLWKFGFNSFGAITFESARYTAQYSMKKQYGKHAKEYYEKMGIIPEFILCSNRRGIGYDTVMDDIKSCSSFFERGYRVVNGVKLPIPRYYEKVLEEEVPDYFKSYKAKKIARAEAFQIDSERCKAREKILKKRCDNFRHSLDKVE